MACADYQVPLCACAALPLELSELSTVAQHPWPSAEPVLEQGGMPLCRASALDRAMAEMLPSTSGGRAAKSREDDELEHAPRVHVLVQYILEP